MAREIKITIEGVPATGKSAIAQMITAELRRYGMTVRNYDEDAPRRDLQLENLLMQIGTSTSVTILTIRKAREL